MKKKIKIAIDSPAAAGAGSQAALLAKYYNLFYLDTGKIYRFVGNLKILYNNNFSYNLVKKRIKKLKIKNLQNKKLLTNKVALEASIVAKDLKIRKIVHDFQIKCTKNPPKKFNGIILDGRDITSVIMKDAEFKFFITANVKTRAQRRYKELKSLKKKISFKEVLKSIKKRDKSDKNRKISPLQKTKDMYLINSSSHAISTIFMKIKKIIDRKINS